MSKQTDLTVIAGVGKKIQQNLNEKGIRTVAQLKRHWRKHTDILPTEVQYSLQYNPTTEISWDTAHSILSLFPPGYTGVGGYRRKKAFLHDIDIMTLKSPDQVKRDLRTMHARAIKEESTFRFLGLYAEGTRRLGVMISHKDYNYRTDIFFTTKEEYPYALLHYTGSKQFNIRIRAKAKHLKLKLNQFGLYDAKNNIIVLKNEKAILKYLGIKYVAPPLR